MGYTHYIYQKTELPKDKWQAFIKDVKAILKNPDVPLAYEYDSLDKSPMVDENVVRFNGVNDDGYETFIITRESIRQTYLDALSEDKEKMAFGFCKTACKPYDKYVTACLILAKIHFGDDVRILSDGKVSDWSNGRQIVEKLHNTKLELTSDNNRRFSVIFSDVVNN